MSDLIEFLRARLHEDEAVAQAATAGPWEWVPDGRDGDRMLVAPTVRHSYETAYSSGSIPEQVIAAIGMHSEGWVSVEGADAEHIARWDPARVLAEIEAKRAVLDLARESAGLESGLDFELGHGSGPRDEDDPYVGDRILRALVQPYADHPDFDPAWRTA